MAITDHKLKDSDIAAKGVVAAPTILNGTPEENKKIFDRLVREVLKEDFNSLIDALSAATGAGEIGAVVEGLTGATVQAILNAVKLCLDSKVAEADYTAALALKSDKSVTNNHIKTVELDGDTGVFTFTRENGTKITIDTALEKVAVNFTYDAESQSLVLTLADGSTETVSLAAFITTTEFEDSATLEWSVSADGSKVKATIKDGCITDSMLSSALTAMLQGYVQAAAASATCAETAQAAAEDAKTAAEAAKAAAEAAQTAAETAETGAKSSAASAGNSASSARSSSSSASSAAGRAGNSASSAASAAERASSSANSAAEKASAAESHAREAKTYRDDAYTYANSARNAASGASLSASNAATSAEAAKTAAETAEAANANPPYISDDGYWMCWDVEQGAYTKTTVKAQGPAGEDGISPTVTLQNTYAAGLIPAVKVTITDKDGDHSFTIKDGKAGKNGTAGVHGDSVQVLTSELSGTEEHPNGGYQITFRQTTYPASGGNSTITSQSLQLWHGDNSKWFVQAAQPESGSAGDLWLDANGSVKQCDDSGQWTDTEVNIKGSDASVTADNIAAALGFTPVSQTQLSGKQDQHGKATATLAAANWADNTLTVAVAGVTASNDVIVSPAPASTLAWAKAQVYCSAQGAGTLTFTCTDTPNEDLVANIVILP